jgi:segregation and condensation protein A
MRKCAAKLLARDQLGRNFFPRGIEENIERTKNITYQASLLDLMQAYARIKTKDEFKPFVFERNSILTMEQALVRMRSLIGHAITWSDLRSFLPDGWDIDSKRLRSATASTFAAALELAKHGLIELEQNDSFSPIKLRKKVE